MAKYKNTRVTIKKSGRNQDYFIVEGGLSTHKPILVMSKTEAQKIANARRAVVEKRAKKIRKP